MDPVRQAARGLARLSCIVGLAWLGACGGGKDGGVTTPPVVTPPVDSELPRTYAPTGRASAGDTFVHLFEWRWPDIARECEVFLGPAGYKAVQVSPPQEHAVIAQGGSYPWWQRYQPVSYTLANSRSGTAAEFADMVARCRTAGVDIYVDAVINHMTAGSGNGSAGSAYTKYSYPAVPYTQAEFHLPCSINSYADASQVQGCELVGLADLRTEDEAVRARLAAYLIALQQLGVAGFRIDAAKHMKPRDVDNILGRVNQAAAAAGKPRPYVFLEVVSNAGEAVTPGQYYGVGYATGGASDITDFQYSYRISDGFLGRNGSAPAALLNTLADGLLPADKSVVFTDNHDNQRASNIYYADAGYEQAVELMLAVPVGYPSVMSSFGFDRGSTAGRDAGPPSVGPVTTPTFDAGGASRCTVTLGSPQQSQWICEHRRPAIAAMVRFRKVAAGAPLSKCGRSDWLIGGNPLALALCRDGAGFLALNRGTAAVSEDLPTRLPAGSYCNVAQFIYTPAAGTVPAGCTGPAVVVGADGTARITLPAGGSVALHGQARVG